MRVDLPKKKSNPLSLKMKIKIHYFLKNFCWTLFTFLRSYSLANLFIYTYIYIFFVHCFVLFHYNDLWGFFLLILAISEVNFQILKWSLVHKHDLKKNIFFRRKWKTLFSCLLAPCSVGQRYCSFHFIINGVFPLEIVRVFPFVLDVLNFTSHVEKS